MVQMYGIQVPLWCYWLQIIDPYVKVEIAGLPADCSECRTKVVDDNGEW